MELSGGYKVDWGGDVQMMEETAAVYKKEAVSTALPRLELRADYKRNLKDNFLYIDFPDFETGEMTNQKFKINYKNEYGLNAVLSQTLSSFKVGAALKAAKEYKQLTDFAGPGRFFKRALAAGGSTFRFVCPVNH
ncbi:MAG: hypothetical protein GY950_31380 [bacterium]|nr:hypothetical protein [bacterium]